MDFPNIPHSSSLPSIFFSTMILSSYFAATSIPVIKSSLEYAFVMPTEEPRFAGLIKQG